MIIWLIFSQCNLGMIDERIELKLQWYADYRTASSIKNPFLLAQDIIWTSIQRLLNVMDVIWTSKQRCVLTGKKELDCRIYGNPGHPP